MAKVTCLRFLPVVVVAGGTIIKELGNYIQRKSGAQHTVWQKVADWELSSPRSYGWCRVDLEDSSRKFHQLLNIFPLIFSYSFTIYEQAKKFWISMSLNYWIPDERTFNVYSVFIDTEWIWRLLQMVWKQQYTYIKYITYHVMLQLSYSFSYTLMCTDFPCSVEFRVKASQFYASALTSHPLWYSFSLL